MRIAMLNYPKIPDFSHDNDICTTLRTYLDDIAQIFDMAVFQRTPIDKVVHARCAMTDELFIKLFAYYQLDKQNLLMFATGGYGRGELHPHSDIDVLLLSLDTITNTLNKQISDFIAVLWDIGLQPAVVARSLADCEIACQDITVATSLLETRLLAGDDKFIGLPLQILQKNWSNAHFYQAKADETKVRYLKYNPTESNLEPDIKNAVGGLRDIQTIGWIWKQYLQTDSFVSLLEQGVLTASEFNSLQQSQFFLWQIRYHLHQMTGRDENRLLFDYQRVVAEKMGYSVDETAHQNAFVERFMKDYYRFAMSNAILLDRLSQYYCEVVLEKDISLSQKTINERFKLVGNQIAIVHSQIFSQYPTAMLELFLLMGQMNIRQIRSCTLRALATCSEAIDEIFRQNAVNQQLFIANLKEQNLLFHRLQMMKRYGVLGRYLPAFGQIVGLMQYDLFHRYTVDTHTLWLIRILRRFTNDKYQTIFPLVSSIYRRIEHKEILVLAGIFHDIAKGQGGDHSELGELEVRAFGAVHGLPQADCDLIAWLVKHHLLMSKTAQKKDISDPAVVADFAEQVGNVTYLNHLYVLTVADMTATNPQLWNSWRATLMRQLYIQTRRILRADIDAPTNRQDMIANNRELTEQLLTDDPDKAVIQRLWQELGDEYFLRETPNDIIWQSRAIIEHEKTQKDEPLIILREHQELSVDAVQVFIYTKDQANLFATTVSVFDRMDLNVLDAKIITATKDFAIDSYVVLDRHRTLLNDSQRQLELKQWLSQAILASTYQKIVQKRLPRTLKNFQIPTQIEFSFNQETKQHMVLLETLDQPALLARVGQVFLKHQIQLHFARITTLGERVEDIFFISDNQGGALADDILERLKNDLIKILQI